MEPSPLLSLIEDPYVLAYRYAEYMKKYPLSKANGERRNPYFESLLANQDDPPESDNDPQSRAIRYAKQHYECYYQKKDIPMIVQMLDGASVTEPLEQSPPKQPKAAKGE